MIVPEIVFLTTQLYERVNGLLMAPDAARDQRDVLVDAPQPAVRRDRLRVLRRVLRRRVRRALRSRSHSVAR